MKLIRHLNDDVHRLSREEKVTRAPTAEKKAFNTTDESIVGFHSQINEMAINGTEIKITNFK